MSEIVCPSLRASNPICFMAAVGLLRTCQERLTKLGRACMKWAWQEPDWVAVLDVSEPTDREDLLDALASMQFPEPREEFAWRDELKKLTRADFVARANSISKAERYWLSALAAENASGGKEKPVTPFDTTAGQWKLLAKFRAIHAAMFPTPASPTHTLAKFREALFAEWQYDDAEICFNWDPDLVPEGAYCSGDPAKTEKTSVLAATWLAIESLPLFPCDWTTRRLRTRGFVSGPEPMFSWPIWTVPLTLPALNSLLGLPEIIAPSPALRELRQRGVVAVFRSRRWSPTNYGAFSQALLCRSEARS